MINISLLPDLNKEQSAKKPELIAQFDYDNTNEEVDGAMKTFQQQFSSKKGKLAIAAYGLMSVAALVGIIFNPTAVVLYFALALCAGGLIFSLTEKKRTRKKVIEALSGMNPESYSCAIYPEKVEIETIIKPKDGVDIDGGSEELPVLKSVFKFGEAILNFAENKESLLMIVNGRQIYCFPKRCLTEEQQNTVREFLKNKLEE